MLMVTSDNDTIKAPEDLKKNPDGKVCSVDRLDAVGEHQAVPRRPTNQLVLFDVYDKCADALENDQVDAVTTDNVILLGFVAESDGEFKLVGEQFTEEPYGIGIKKGDVDFCEFINKTLQDNEDAYIEAWEDTAGQVEGTEAPELPEPDPCA